MIEIRFARERDIDSWMNLVNKVKKIFQVLRPDRL